VMSGGFNAHAVWPMKIAEPPGGWWKQAAASWTCATAHGLTLLTPDETLALWREI
jgi:hypothetical protein